MKNTINTLLFLLVPLLALTQTNSVSGTVLEAMTNEPMSGASVVGSGKMIGTTTDDKGYFMLHVTQGYPVSLRISFIGYGTREVLVENGEPLTIHLDTKNELLEGLVISASRIPENILQSPVSIEKMGAVDIRETPSFDFYDGLQNLKGLDMVTSSLTYKEINTRGFNDTGNARFLQLVDGVDNQTP